jgi:benzoyl-CoA reductase subunit BamC
MCEGEEEPLCVKWCTVDALTYEEREEDIEEAADQKQDLDIGLESLADKYGLQQILDAVARMSKKD